MTALTGLDDLRNIDKAFALTNRLRTEGTEHLLAAARATGVERCRPVLRGLALRAHRRPGQDRGRPARPRPAEGHPRDARRHPPPRGARPPRPAASSCATAASTAPGTGLAPGRRAVGWSASAQVPARRQRRRRVVVPAHRGPRDRDAGRDRARPPGEIYNVVDDEPAPVREWLPFLAAAIGAKPPRKRPGVARPGCVGEPGVVADDDEVRGASNAKGEGRARLDAARGRPGARASRR